MWAVLAFAKLGDGDKASELFAMLNPIGHALTAVDAERYKVEPYVVAADIYSVAPHVGRGGWTWYTGAAGWMHRAGVEGILGIRREGVELVLDPCMPSTWPQFEAELVVAGTRYSILLENPSQRGRGITSAVLDDRPIAAIGGAIRLPLAGGTHHAHLSIQSSREVRAGTRQARTGTNTGKSEPIRTTLHAKTSEVNMVKPNYGFDKRQRELKKAKQQEEKRQKKLARNPSPEPPAKPPEQAS